MGFKSVPYSTIVCGSKGEVYSYDPLCLSAPNNSVYSTTFTSVNFASYGTPNGGCGGYSYGGCHAGNSGNIVSNAFIGRTSGCVSPDNGTFGDPCVGTYKRLYIQLTASGTQQVFVPVPVINSFAASPNPQNSSGATPLYSTTLSWASTNGLTAVITSSAGESWSVQPSGSLDITNLPQSTVGAISPSSRYYTLTVYNELNESDSETIEVLARNDHSPSNTWTTSWNMLEPETTYVKLLGVLAGVDMPTRCVASTDSTGANNTFFTINAAGSGAASTKTFTVGNTIYLQFTSLPFNNNISGQTGIYGNTNTKTVPITVGSQSFTVTIQTRAPIISEEFPSDFYFINQSLPNPDIDVINSPTPSQYLVSTEMVIDDVELSASTNSVEIKTDNPDLEVRIKPSGTSSYGNWKNVRQI